MKQVFSLEPADLGAGKVTFQWSPKGNYLAVAGPKRKVMILDRNGRIFDEVGLPASDLAPDEESRSSWAGMVPGRQSMAGGSGGSSSCRELQWDPVNEQLAILPTGNSVALIWSPVTKDSLRIDSEFKTQELSTLAWSKNGVYLAMGTSKGNLMIYNCRERKKTPYVGKHTRKIAHAVWNKDGLLATTGPDRNINITDGATGETLHVFSVSADPQDLCVSDKKDDGYSKREENTYSLNVGCKTLYIMQLAGDSQRPLELAFLDAYGTIQKHIWFGDGYILVGFRSGKIVVVSSHNREIAEEIHQGQYLDVLSDAAYSPSLGRIAMAGSNQIRILDVSGNTYVELKGDAIDLDTNINVEQIGWTKDGQILTVASTMGHLKTFLANLSVVYATFDTQVIYLTSMLEMTVVDTTKRGQTIRLDIETEPSFCGLGPNHAAVGMNNQVWYYRLGQREGKLVGRRDYMGTVLAVKLNATHVVVLLEGKVVVHPIEVKKAVGGGHSADDLDMILPPQGQIQTLTSLSVSKHFIVTSSKQGIISYYLAEDCSPVNEYRHEDGAVSRTFPQPDGARMIFEDDKSQLHVFNPVNDQTLLVPDVARKADLVMWDSQDSSVFVVISQGEVGVYLYTPVSLNGPRVELVSKESIPGSHTPLLLCNGVITCRLRTGAIDNIVLESHRLLQNSPQASQKNAPVKKLAQCLKLGRLKAAWEAALQLKCPDAWRSIALAALEKLDLDVAQAAYRMLGDASMVLSLESIRGIEDKNLVSGHTLVLLDRDIAQAQELFLRSSLPKAALEMRKDLKHWSEALKLADQLDPESIPVISKEHAASLEMTGEYNNAKIHYQQAMDSLMGSYNPDVELACRAGLARCTMQLGDIRQGRAMINQLNSIPLYKEAAQILEGLQQLAEAAEMYDKAGQSERAASIYIQAKNFNAAAPLMAKVSSSKLQMQFAKAKEAESRYGEACTAYEAAGDMDSVVRLSIERLNQPQKAYAIVRKTKSIEAAAMLSRHCLQAKDFKGAVEFLLLAGQMDQAFDIAMGHSEMDTFARIITLSAKPVDHQRIAQYYESRGEYDKAADMWAQSGQEAKAVALYLKVGTNPAIEKAIALVQKTRNHTIGVQVLDFVNEEKDGSSKDEFRFKLNIAMGQYSEAARDAMEMARFEQEEGNYRVAHDKLHGTVVQMESLNKAVPTELMRMLSLLHSYTLVKSLIAVEDHTTAARMLVRVAKNISKFPKHIVPILTSTVIECHRAGLKKTSLEYASMLMRPEYRKSVAAKYQKKIELMVRKPDKDAEDIDEAMLECPFCNLPGPETELQCIQCQNIIPFDIATGKRMVLADWAECPKCKFACSSRHMTHVLAVEKCCPMCNEDVTPDEIKRIADPIGDIRKKAEAAAGL